MKKTSLFLLVGFGLLLSSCSAFSSASIVQEERQIAQVGSLQERFASYTQEISVADSQGLSPTDLDRFCTQYQRAFHSALDVVSGRGIFSSEREVLVSIFQNVRVLCGDDRFAFFLDEISDDDIAYLAAVNVDAIFTLLDGERQQARNDELQRTCVVLLKSIRERVQSYLVLPPADQQREQAALIRIIQEYLSRCQELYQEAYTTAQIEEIFQGNTSKDFLDLILALEEDQQSFEGDNEIDLGDSLNESSPEPDSIDPELKAISERKQSLSERYSALLNSPSCDLDRFEKRYNRLSKAYDEEKDQLSEPAGLFYRGEIMETLSTILDQMDTLLEGMKAAIEECEEKRNDEAYQAFINDNNIDIWDQPDDGSELADPKSIDALLDPENWDSGNDYYEGIQGADSDEKSTDASSEGDDPSSASEEDGNNEDGGAEDDPSLIANGLRSQHMDIQAAYADFVTGLIRSNGECFDSLQKEGFFKGWLELHKAFRDVLNEFQPGVLWDVEKHLYIQRANTILKEMGDYVAGLKTEYAALKDCPKVDRVESFDDSEYADDSSQGAALAAFLFPKQYTAGVIERTEEPEDASGDKEPDTLYGDGSFDASSLLPPVTEDLITEKDVLHADAVYKECLEFYTDLPKCPGECDQYQPGQNNEPEDEDEFEPEDPEDLGDGEVIL